MLNVESSTHLDKAIKDYEVSSGNTLVESNHLMQRSIGLHLETVEAVQEERIILIAIVLLVTSERTANG